MSYLVLARKYRPQTFNEVVGQEHVTKTLSNAFTQDRVHHAFLFCGPRGCGKTTTARVLAKALNCEQGPTPEPCGTCEACVSIANGTAVDYFEMDGASNRGIDSIRELTEAVRYQPAVLRKKVYVIDEVHMLTTEAFNALLKTLEEPPPHVTFVMATTEPHKVPNTILSRCQRFDFKLVPVSRLSEHLRSIFAKEEIPVDEGATNLVVRESGGSVRDALSLCDQIISYVGAEGIDERRVAEVLGVADRGLTRSLVQALAAGDAATCLEAVDAAVGRGVDEVQIARAVVRYLRDLAVAQVAPGSESLIEASADERKEILAEAKELSASRVRQMFDRMLRTCDDLGETEQPRLVLDLGLIDVAATEDVVPLGDLVERLAAMERRLTGGGGGAPRSPGGGSKSLSSKSSSNASARSESASAERPSSAAPAPQFAPAPRAAPVESRASAPSPTAAPPPVAARVAPPPESTPAPPAQRAEAPAPALGPSAPVPKAQVAEGSGSTHNPLETNPLKAWESAMSALEKASEFGLMTVYQTAKVLAFNGEHVKVGFPSDGLTSEIATDKEKIDRMQLFLEAHCKRKLRFEVVLLTPEEEAAAKSILEEAKIRAKEEHARRQEEAQEHPVTKHALRTFGAAIKEIKIENV